MKTMVTLGSLGAVAFLTALILMNSSSTKKRATSSNSSGHEKALRLYCAAGIRNPVYRAVEDYGKEYGVRIELQYGGSGTLLSQMQAAKKGDMYLAADTLHIDKARQMGLVAESIPLAFQKPTIAVRRDSSWTHKIKIIEDLLMKDLKVSLAHPEQASVGKQTKRILTNKGLWKKLEGKTSVFRSTVNEVAIDVKLGKVDAGIIWDASVIQYPELQSIEVEVFRGKEQNITISLLRTTIDPKASLTFMRYLGARDKGLVHFSRFGYRPVIGDVWKKNPVLIFYCGGLNRIAIEDSIKAFESREGCLVRTIYNGCGILVGQMKAGARPDAYLNCDVSFAPPVSKLFNTFVSVSETDIVMLVKKGNPYKVEKLRDLLERDLRIGMTNPEMSALGHLVKTLLETRGWYQTLYPKIKSQTPAADMVVNQMLTGSLDVGFVSRANAALVKDKLEIVTIDGGDTVAKQSFAVGKSSDHRFLADRLFQFLLQESSQKKYLNSGFRFKAKELSSALP